MPTALLKVQRTVRPYSGDVLGLRVRAAESNTGHPIFGPRFDKPFQLWNGSDHTVILVEHVKQVEQWLKQRGWRIEYFGKVVAIVLAKGSLHMAAAPLDDDDEPEVEHTQERILASFSNWTEEEQASFLAQLQTLTQSVD